MKPFLSTNCAFIYEAMAQQWLFFSKPSAVYKTSQVLEVRSLLDSIHHHVEKEKAHAVGFISYEAAAGLDSVFPEKTPGFLPLVWFGIYKNPQVYNWSFFQKLSIEKKRERGPLPPIPWQLSIPEKEYYKALKKIKDYIQNGESCQVNYSLRVHSPLCFTPWDLFLQMLQSQGRNSYGAFLQTEDWAVCSASPELFFQLNGSRIYCRPMKGTAPRGLTFEDDRRRAKNLQLSSKERAGNAMIVDMVRNDLGKICKIKTVKINELFTLEQYPTLWQMTSEVQGETLAGFSDIVGALFPPASVTGAPKPQTVKIISELESDSRDIYTGAIGFWAPQRRAQFNVAIRTAWMDRHKKEAHYGIGGGIVWDSIMKQEWEECRIKAKVLNKYYPDFFLLETMLWTPEKGFFLLDCHMKRLTESAVYFGYAIKMDSIEKELKALIDKFELVPYKLRLLVDSDGKISWQKEKLEKERYVKPRKISLAKSAVNSQDIFLYHKTTHRKTYDEAKSTCPEYEDVLLWNEREELTESTKANAAIEIDGELFTPPVSCGLLAGTYRAFLLQRGKIKERVLPVKDLSRESKIFLLNSVQKSWEVYL